MNKKTDNVKTESVKTKHSKTPKTNQIQTEVPVDIQTLLNAIELTQTEQRNLEDKIKALYNQQHLTVKFKTFTGKATPPSYVTTFAAGADLTVTEIEYDTTNKIYKYHTGLAIEIPEGYLGLLFPKSNIADRDLTLANCVGVIDSDYRGEICGKFRPVKKHNWLLRWFFGSTIYQPGEMCLQLIIIPYPKVHFIGVEQLSETKRGTKGFGEMDKQVLTETKTNNE